MKQFFKMMFASMFGVLLAIFVAFLLIIAIASAVISGLENKEVKVKENSLLHIKFDSPITERTSKNPFENFNFSDMSTKGNIGLNDITENIKRAAEDANIKGIYLDLTSMPAGWAATREIRQALLDFKKSEKFIIAYGEIFENKNYYLASVADKIYLNPEGNVFLAGLSAQMMFFRGTLDKLEIKPQVIKHGRYKSAAESFEMDKMSDNNREQITAFINAIYNDMTGAMASSRNMSFAQMDSISDHLLAREASDALHYKLVDELVYKDQMLSILKEKLGVADEDKIEMVSLKGYSNSKAAKKPLAKDKIAVVYAVGPINSGEGDDENIGSDRISKAIRQARKDDNVKAIVLRVNSPGGSALASDVIWREVVLAREKKPVVVSMGDVAASGGYYISCAADVIVAQPNTITGSIGVIGLLLNGKDMLKNKLGVTTDTYNTGHYSDLGTFTRGLTPTETGIVQNMVDKVYDTFTKKVAEGRKLNLAYVDSIGQGRVWAGSDALAIGLVDTLGGLDVALKIAAQRAGITEYRVRELPTQKDPLMELVKEISGDGESRILQRELGDTYEYYAAWRSMMKSEGVQARMPYYIRIR